jgi:hypothetical protein
MVFMVLPFGLRLVDWPEVAEPEAPGEGVTSFCERPGAASSGVE